LESLGVLAGGIAHDFNNLLTGILGNASLALEEVEPDSSVRSRIEDVVTASERAAQLTRQMLAYSGKGQFLVRRIDLSASIRESVPLIKAAIPSTVELRFNLEEHLPAIEADVAQIQQVTMNIIINGAEAIPEGKPGTVTIATRRQEVDEGYIRTQNVSRVGELKPAPYILFEVSDTGSGMDEATKGRIFDPFFTTKFTGRGLGLAAVLGIVRGHRGCIEVVSRPAQGTNFRVLFPAAERPAELQTPRHREIGNLSGCGTILVVDDEEIVRNTAKHALEHHGCQVLLAEDGAAGLAIFRRETEHITCVVLDLTMPVMSGEETFERMRSLRTDIPIILSSGYDAIESVRRFEGKGLAGFLQKPYKAAALVGIVKDVISRSGQK
jgi:CheY-like chemotaxis protein